MKLKILAVTSLACVCLNQANAADFYAGTSVGVLSLTSNSSIHGGPVHIPDGPTVNINVPNDAGDTDYTGRLFAGYGFDFKNKFYLGIEANGEFNAAEVHTTPTLSIAPIINTISISNTQIEVKNSYGLSVLPGYHIADNFLFYGRAGVAYGTINSSFVGAFSNANQTFHKLGGQFGVGMEYGLSKHLNLRSEYVYTVYGSVEQNVTPGVNFDGSSGITVPVNFSNSINTGAFNLGLNYRF